MSGSSIARQSLLAAMRGNKNNTIRLSRDGWQTMPDPTVALLSYPCTASFGRDQRVCRENDSLDRFLTLLNFVREAQLAQEPANRIGMRLNAGRICQRTSQLRHGHVAVLIDQFDQK